MHTSIHFDHSNVRHINFRLYNYRFLKVRVQHMGHEVSISLSALETQQLIEFVKQHLIDVSTPRL